MKRIILILLLIFPLSACSNNKINNSDESEEFSRTLKDIEDITTKYINYDENNKTNFLGILHDDKEENEVRIKTLDNDQLKSYLKENINGDYKLKWVYDNFDKLEDIEKSLVGNDADAGEFIYNKYNKKTHFKFFPGQSLNLNRETPYYIQWDNRWAYDKLYNSDIGIAGCGPTSMAMTLKRLTNKDNINPRTISKDAQSFMSDNGIAWEFFFDEARKYDISINEIQNNEEEIKKALEKGPIIVSVSHGYFTTSGHIMVIDSYKDGKLLINDPNSVKNSKIKWSYEDIKGQIVILWALSK